MQRIKPKKSHTKKHSSEAVTTTIANSLVGHLKRSEKVLLELLDIDLRRQIYFLSNCQSSGFVHPSSEPVGASVGRTRTLSLIDIFADYHGVFDYFVEFLLQSLCSEAILFLIDLVRWKSATRSEMKKIQAKYISTSSPTEINITHNARMSLNDSIPNGLAAIESTFQVAERETVTLLNADSFPKFLKSKPYQAWLDYLQKVSTMTNEKELPIWRKMVTLVQQNSTTDCLQACMEEGGLVTDSDDKGRTCLHIAVANNNQQMASFLLAHGSDPNILDLKQSTPLHIAASDGDIPLMTLLLDHSASPMLESGEGVIPLQYFARHSCFVVPPLEEVSKPTGLVSPTPHNQSVVNYPNARKLETFLKQPQNIFGIKDRTKELKVDRLREGRERSKALNPQVNLVPPEGGGDYQGLILSSTGDLPDRLRSLFLRLVSQESERIVNHKDSKGETALHYCCRASPLHSGVVFFLLEKGGHVDVCSKKGETPLEILIQNPSISVDLLKSVLSKIGISNFSQPGKNSETPREISILSPDGSATIEVVCCLSPELLNSLQQVPRHLSSGVEEFILGLRSQRSPRVGPSTEEATPTNPPSPTIGRDSPSMLRHQLHTLQQLQAPLLVSRGPSPSSTSPPSIAALSNDVIPKIATT